MFTCPHCGKEIEINKALSHQIEEKLRQQLSQESQEKFAKQKEEIERKAQETIKLEMQDMKNQAKETQEKNTQLQDQLLSLTKTLRELKEKDEQRELLMQKQMLEEREKMREDISKTVMERSRMDKLELEKQLEDTKKALEDAQRKAAQKSQQLQGEVLELELEKLLRQAFPQDTIEPIGKGVNGADIRHLVKSPLGNSCGIILWELKRTKQWGNDWIPKLKQNLRDEKAHVPVIVSFELPPEVKSGLGMKEGVWITSPDLVLPLAELLRKGLLDLARQKALEQNSSDTASQVYHYIIGHEFQQQVEILVETYIAMKQDLQKEKGAFERMWKAREGQIDRILQSAAHIVGSIQGKGATIAQIKGLDLPELLETGEQQELLT